MPSRSDCEGIYWWDAGAKNAEYVDRFENGVKI
jgi:hypothetical protein